MKKIQFTGRFKMSDIYVVRDEWDKEARMFFVRLAPGSYHAVFMVEEDKAETRNGLIWFDSLEDCEAWLNHWGVCDDDSLPETETQVYLVKRKMRSPQGSWFETVLSTHVDKARASSELARIKELFGTSEGKDVSHSMQTVVLK